MWSQADFALKSCKTGWWTCKKKKKGRKDLATCFLYWRWFFCRNNFVKKSPKCMWEMSEDVGEDGNRWCCVWRKIRSLIERRYYGFCGGPLRSSPRRRLWRQPHSLRWSRSNTPRLSKYTLRSHPPAPEFQEEGFLLIFLSIEHSLSKVFQNLRKSFTIYVPPDYVLFHKMLNR